MLKSDIRTLLAQSNLKEAVEAMLQLAAGTRQENEVQLLSARYHELERQSRLGLESSEDIGRTRTKVTHALLQVLEDLPEGSTATLTVSVTKQPPVSVASGDGTSAPPPLTGTGDGTFHRTGTGDGDSSHKNAVWIGIISLALVLAAVMFVPCPSSAQFFVFRLILALGAAGIGSILPGFLTIDSGAAKAGGATGFFVLVYLINPAQLVGDERCNNDPFTLTVSVRVNKPSTAYPDLKNAELWLWQENDWRKVAISPEGIADYKNLSSDLIGKFTIVQLKADYFKPVIDSLLIKPPSATITLEPDGSLERVFGKITDPSGNDLPGIIVEVENRFDTTDAVGNYEIRIPMAQQKTNYSLYARDRKKKFAPYKDEAWPATGAKNFLMKR